ncbi:MAG: hypothetical protein GPOALKHO_001671 [Sodalis sp.]|nr:MAG: hypothetical protein GPOALKHO_001671 [Sodalis sp.]
MLAQKNRGKYIIAHFLTDRTDTERDRNGYISASGLSTPHFAADIEDNICRKPLSAVVDQAGIGYSCHELSLRRLEVVSESLHVSM